ncbi:MAG: hypothetical protein A3K06_00490 [Candidatus Doudnabacteria bacterium RIFCSPHIGHO2_01_52_17]|uniref:Carbohydrate kinase PfkB domain-containing protein n=1 Tax=Candidatus Doudnabacteria bacterium RIFCSPHIGHO2_01_52_17 TaxID=1817820 RepID=A0A1F5NES2_9BACT|nr:MAG: hypothetical protein A3K06_00490 [Candidatus Doudnabacteria bacterium RIFCSPHIGHO2_01_52_17]
MSLDAMVGFSVNLEQIIQIVGDWDTRKPLAVAPHLAASGTSFNVALALARAGLEVKLLGTVGENDPYAGTLEHLISRTGLDPMFFPIREATPITFSLIIPENQVADPHLRQKLMRCKPQFRNHGAVEQAQEQIGRQSELCKPRIVVATGVRSDDVPLVKALFESSAKREGVYRVLAPSIELLADDPQGFRELSGLYDLLALNNYEAGELLTVPEGSEDRFSGLLEWAPEVLVTCNSHGAWYFKRNPRVPHRQWALHQDPYSVAKVVDETGAGDCFLGYFLSCRTGNIEDCLRLAAAAAALKVTRLGGSNMPTREEVASFLATHPTHRVTA